MKALEIGCGISPIELDRFDTFVHVDNSDLYIPKHFNSATHVGSIMCAETLAFRDEVYDFVFAQNFFSDAAVGWSDLYSAEKIAKFTAKSKAERQQELQDQVEQAADKEQFLLEYGHEDYKRTLRETTTKILALQEIHRVLKLGGALVIVDDNTPEVTTYFTSKFMETTGKRPNRQGYLVSQSRKRLFLSSDIKVDHELDEHVLRFTKV